MWFQLALPLLALSTLQGKPLPPSPPPAAPPACLGKKDARRVQKGKRPEKRLVVYTTMAAHAASGLRGCLSPRASTWREGTTPLAFRGPPCPGVDDMFALLDCADRGVREELAAWKLNGAKAEGALRTAFFQLRMSRIFLDEAEDEARQPTRGLGPVPANRIKSRRQALGDDEDKIAGLLCAAGS